LRSAFTVHAYEVIQTRMIINPQDLLNLLDKDLCVPLGYEQGTNKQHRLFYSIDDRECFVAVQDTANGEIVTVLPMQYHNRWKVSPQAESLAIELVMPKPRLQKSTNGNRKTPLRLMVIVLDKDSKKIAFHLEPLVMEDYGAGINAVVANAQFHKELNVLVAAKLAGQKLCSVTLIVEKPGLRVQRTTLCYG
jgi:hypothetical protein